MKTHNNYMEKEDRVFLMGLKGELSELV